MEYNWYRVIAIWENNKQIEFNISGVDENSVGQTASKLEGIKYIKEIRKSTREEINEEVFRL
jgi:uncharacterized protein YlbG (UPF0298 family)